MTSMQRALQMMMQILKTTIDSSKWPKRSSISLVSTQTVINNLTAEPNIEDGQQDAVGAA